jgi:hypothetical protein
VVVAALLNISVEVVEAAFLENTAKRSTQCGYSSGNDENCSKITQGKLLEATTRGLSSSRRFFSLGTSLDQQGVVEQQKRQLKQRRRRRRLDYGKYLLSEHELDVDAALECAESAAPGTLAWFGYHGGGRTSSTSTTAAAATSATTSGRSHRQENVSSLALQVNEEVVDDQGDLEALKK